MTQITYRDWMFDCDVDTTHHGYETISTGGVETCECAGCKNFLAQREAVFPEEIRRLFNELGVNYKRDAEIYHMARLQPGLHLYGGWFHFVGKILKEPIGPAKLNNFTVDFIPDRSLAAKVFENHTLVQIEITVEVPWVISDRKWINRRAMPNKRLQRTGISVPLIDNLPLGQLSPGR